jgi:hypothetical protein
MAFWDTMPLSDAFKDLYGMHVYPVEHYFDDEPVTYRDDSGIPEWLLQDNATYFRELHRVMDDVPAPLGVRVPRR